MQQANNISIPIWAIVVTTLWVCWFVLYLYQDVRVAYLEPDEVGDLLAGWFAPLAFMWFVVAVLLQKDELALQRRELKETRGALTRQAETLEEQYKVARLELFSRLSERYEYQISYFIDHILKSSGGYKEAERENHWNLFSQGNRGIFARVLLNRFLEENGIEKAMVNFERQLNGPPRRSENMNRALTQICGVYEQYREEIRNVGGDPEKILIYSEFREVCEILKERIMPKLKITA